MDKHTQASNSEQSLHLLKEIGQNPSLTQRDLSKKLNLSLGKINFLIKALVAKGIIKTQNFKNSKNKLAYLYLITPRGLETKFQLTQKFLNLKIEEYEKLRREIEVLNKEATSLKPAEHVEENINTAVGTSFKI